MKNPNRSRMVVMPKGKQDAVAEEAKKILAAEVAEKAIKKLLSYYERESKRMNKKGGLFDRNLAAKTLRKIREILEEGDVVVGERRLSRSTRARIQLLKEHIAQVEELKRLSS